MKFTLTIDIDNLVMNNWTKYYPYEWYELIGYWHQVVKRFVKKQIFTKIVNDLYEYLHIYCKCKVHFFSMVLYTACHVNVICIFFVFIQIFIFLVVMTA